MTSTSTQKALVRFGGEIATKARRARKRFLQRLTQNIRDSLSDQGESRVQQQWGRIFVEAKELRPLQRVFGVHSYSPIRAECPAHMEAIVKQGEQAFAQQVEGTTFAVRVHRAGDHPFSSQDIKVELGRRLNQSAKVDLDNPVVEVPVEVRQDRTYFLADSQKGPGGLPLGVQGKGLALISGGFDSAVAAWMILKRGIELDYLFCNLGGGAYQRLTLEVAKSLADRWSYGTRPQIHVIDFNPVVQHLRERVKSSYLQVILKRLMYQAGQKVAQKIDARALVTGESIGQVSSQTLANLGAIEEAISLPVLRPLAGQDKEEIMQQARRIDTYALSQRVKEYCAIVPDYPVVATTARRARAQHERLDPTVLEESLEQGETYDLRTMTATDIAAPHLFVEEIPEDARVVDTRSRSAFKSWHWPRAQHYPLEELLEEYQGLDKQPTYVLYCQAGMQTAHLAEQMQAAGYEAYSLKGGVARLRQLWNHE